MRLPCESLLRAICAFLQIYLCLLANVFLLSIKCMFVCYQIYSILYLCFPVQNPIQLAKNIFFCFVRQDGEISIAV